MEGAALPFAVCRDGYYKLGILGTLASAGLNTMFSQPHKMAATEE